jgi:uncharacterized membrane protein YfcA
MMPLENWFVFPIAIVFATIAMASGVEGSTFFSPFFMIALGLEPEVAIGTGLITEVFGFGSGLYAYARKKLIDYKLGLSLLLVTVPAALVGVWLGGILPATALKAIFGTGLVAVAFSLLRSPDHQTVERADRDIKDDFGANPETCLTTSGGEQICYTVCNKTEGRMIASVGGLFIGMLSTGLGELNAYFLLQRCRVPSKVAVGTSVFLVAITALVASVGHVAKFAQAGGETVDTVLGLVVFTIPGVLIGGQLSPLLAAKVSPSVMEKALALLFIVVAALTFYQLV